MLSTDEVKHIATLARIGLTSAEVAHFQKDLSAVLEWFEELKNVDISDAPAETSMASGPHHAAADIEQLSGEAARILENAPDKQDGSFKVKSVF